MDLKQLRYFIAVAEEGSISMAAKKLHMSQPPLSQQIKLLEQELGVLLMERGPRNITLTTAGHTLYKKALTILEFTQTTRKEIEDLGKGLRGALHLGTISSSGKVLLSPKLTAFHEKYPDICFEVHEGNTFELLELLDQGIIETAIVRTPFPTEGLEYFPMHQECMAACAHPSFFDTVTDDFVSIAFFEQKPLIYYRRFEKLFRACFDAHGIHPTVFCRNDDARTSLMWADTGMGIALVPESISHVINSDSIICKRIDEKELYTQVCAIWKKDRYLSTVAREFLKSLK